jgi:hypothetical protein
MPQALLTIHGAGLAGGPRGCAPGRNDSMRTIWPRQHFGQSRNDWPVRRSYRSRLDGGHDTALPTAERLSVIVTVRKPDLTEDVRHLEPLGAHCDPQK